MSGGDDTGDGATEKVAANFILLQRRINKQNKTEIRKKEKQKCYTVAGGSKGCYTAARGNLAVSLSSFQHTASLCH